MIEAFRKIWKFSGAERSNINKSVAVSIIGNAVTNSFSKMQQTHAGYFMAANERIKIGNLLKGMPMGFFNENSLGEVTGVCTTVLEYVQGMGVVKSFNLSGKGDRTVQEALEFNRKSNLDMERLMTPYSIFQELVLQIVGIAMLRLSSASIDRTLQTEEMEQMDEATANVDPKNEDRLQSPV